MRPVRPRRRYRARPAPGTDPWSSRRLAGTSVKVPPGRFDGRRRVGREGPGGIGPRPRNPHPFDRPLPAYPRRHKQRGPDRNPQSGLHRGSPSPNEAGEPFLPAPDLQVADDSPTGCGRSVGCFRRARRAGPRWRPSGRCNPGFSLLPRRPAIAGGRNRPRRTGRSSGTSRLRRERRGRSGCEVAVQ